VRELKRAETNFSWDKVEEGTMRELQCNRITNKRQVSELHTLWVSTCYVSKLCSFLSYFILYFFMKCLKYKVLGKIVNVILKTSCCID